MKYVEWFFTSSTVRLTVGIIALVLAMNYYTQAYEEITSLTLIYALASMMWAAASAQMIIGVLRAELRRAVKEAS